MKLPFPMLRKKTLASYFLVLILRHEKAHAVIFEEQEGEIKVLGESEEEFKTSVEEADIEELLGTVDKAISKAEEALPPNIETQNTVFGLKENWVEKDGIKKEYLAKLKKLGEELGLKPLGFLVIHEAIAHLLQKEEGAPVSSILVEIGKTYVTVSLIRAGRIIESKTGGIIEENAAQSVDALLKNFQTQEILPARVITFGDTRDLEQEFITHTWSKSLPFLHLPQITNLAINFDARAVLFGAAKEMGFEVIPEHLQTSKTEEPEEKEEIPLTLPSDYFGFLENADVGKAEPSKIQTVQDEEIQEKIEEIPQELKIKGAESKALPALAVTLAAGGFSIIKKFISSVKIPAKIPLRIPFAGKKISFILPLVLVISVAIFVLVYFFGTAKITVNVLQEETQKNQDILFSSAAATNLDNNTIASEVVSTAEEGSASQQTTGEKEVGEKAKGTVTIFNSSGSTITLPAKTIITSDTSTKLNFVTLTSVTVASRSGDVPPEPGKANVNVEADEIGTEYNLPSAVKFLSINGNADIAAKNDNPFSGGTKKEVRVVSKKDLSDLETKLIKDLEGKARESIKGGMSSSKFLLPDFINQSFTNKTFNKKEGEEATSITLNGTVEYQSLSYDKKDLISYTKSLFGSEEKNGLKLDEENIELNIAEIKTRNKDSIEANVNIKARLKPEISIEDLAKKLSGKSLKEAEEEILKMPQVSSVNISVFPRFLFLGNSLPSRSKNISVVISVDE